MSLFQIFNAFEKYSLEILLIAAAVVAATSFIKRVILRGKFKKLVTLIPFVLGVLFYSLYLYAYLKVPIKGLIAANALKNGIITGGLGTVYYVFYEQFIRGKREVFPLSLSELAAHGILSTIVIKELLEQTSKEVVARISDKLVDTGYCVDIISDIVKGRLLEGVNQQDIILHARLVVSALTALR